MGKFMQRTGNGAKGSKLPKVEGDSKGSTTTTTTFKKEYKFSPYSAIGNSKLNYATYTEVRKQVIAKVGERVKQHPKDIVESLEKETYIDLDTVKPKRAMVEEGPGITAKDDEAARANKMAIFNNKQRGLDIEFQSAMTVWQARKQAMEDNKREAYDIVISYCTGVMTAKVEEQDDFETKLKGDPIETLKRIMVLVHDPVKAKYHWASFKEAMVRLCSCKQHSEESLLEYVRRFKQAAAILKTHLPKDGLEPFIKKTPVVDMGLYRYPLQLICAFTDTQSNREVNPGSNLGYIPYHKGIMYVL